MRLNRIDLADIHDPARLARAVHRQLGHEAGPVPVTDIALALDISDVRLDVFDGFEGMLLTDRVRSQGIILANTAKNARRARFTIAHELGHFLLERHVLSRDSGFTCSSGDMRETHAKGRHQRQESEASRFAIELLAPPKLVDPLLGTDPDLRDAQRLRDRLDISLEACVRRMIERHDAPLAAIWSHQGQVRYVTRGASFPYVTLGRGDPLPRDTDAARAVSNAKAGFTDLAETHALAWTRQPDLEIFEQTRLTASGHAVTLLSIEPTDNEEEDDSGLEELGMPRFR